MANLLLTVLAFFAIMISRAQEEIKTAAYFDVDASHLTEDQELLLSNFMQSLDSNRIVCIKLNGNTDSDASIEYNQRLSERRTKTVLDFVESRGIPEERILDDSFGESNPITTNETEEGKRRNRRVEIIVSVLNVSTGEPPCKPVPESIKDCNRDTTLTFPQGTSVTFNICDFELVKDCFKFQEFNTAKSLRNSELTTQTSDGSPMITGGMMDITLCGGVCATIRVPVRETCNSNVPMSLWEANDDGTWGRPNPNGVQIVRIDGRDYYQYRVCRSGKKNVDFKVSKPPKMKVIGKKIKKFLVVKVSFDCPATLLSQNHRPIRRNKATFKIFCPNSEPYIYAKAIDNKGDTIEMQFRPGNTLDKREVIGKCKNDEVLKRVLFFNVKEKVMYRKYIIRRTDYDDFKAGN